MTVGCSLGLPGAARATHAPCWPTPRTVPASRATCSRCRGSDTRSALEAKRYMSRGQPARRHHDGDAPLGRLGTTTPAAAGSSTDSREAGRGEALDTATWREGGRVDRVFDLDVPDDPFVGRLSVASCARIRARAYDASANPPQSRTVRPRWVASSNGQGHRGGDRQPRPRSSDSPGRRLLRPGRFTPDVDGVSRSMTSRPTCSPRSTTRRRRGRSADAVTRKVEVRSRPDAADGGSRRPRSSRSSSDT